MPDSKDTDDPSSSRPSGEDLPSERYLNLLHERFPHVKAVMDELLKHSPTFRDLVDEYGACADVLDRFASYRSATSLLQEYGSLQLRLERELLQYIQNYPGTDDNS